MADDPEFFVRRVAKARRFWIGMPDRARSAPAVGVVGGGWEVCGPGYRVARPGLPWFGIELVVDGRGSLTLAGSDHALSSGALFTYGPGIAHGIISDPGAPMRKYFVDLAGPGAARALARAGIPPGTMVHVAPPTRVRAIFDLLIDAGCSGGATAAPLCAALATAALVAITSDAVALGRAQEPAYATYLRCRAWLDDRGSDAATITQAARACGVSAPYLCRLFRRYDRVSPGQLLRARRLQRGAELLADPRLRVADVADRLGYADAFHFSRAFTRAFGIAPQRFRSLRAGSGTT